MKTSIIAARDALYAHAMNLRITLPCATQFSKQQIESMKQQEVALEQADLATRKLFQHRMIIKPRRVGSGYLAQEGLNLFNGYGHALGPWVGVVHSGTV